MAHVRDMKMTLIPVLVARYLFMVIAAVFVCSLRAEEIPADMDAVFARYVKLGEDLGQVMVRVKDKESAEAENAALQALLPRVGESRREIGAITQLPPDLATEITRKYERSMREVWGRVYESIYRLQRVRCYESISFFRSFSLLCSLLGS